LYTFKWCLGKRPILYTGEGKTALPFFCKYDLIIITVAIATCLFLTFFIPRNGRAEYVIVEVNGKEAYRYAIFHDGEYPIYRSGALFQKETPLLLLHIDNESVYVTNSTCPDKICEKTGEIHRAGQVIVCVPNKVLIRIEGTTIQNGEDIPDVYTK
jgi:hypothetical protein